MERVKVYELIDGERDYQDSLDATRKEPSETPHTVGDYITMLHHYMRKLDEAWTVHAGTEHALDVMRKIGGISVHCMEDHGAPPR